MSAGAGMIGFCLLLASQQAAAPTAITPEPMRQIVERFSYSPAIRAGDFVFVSGVVAVPAAGAEALSFQDRMTAYERAFAMASRILETAGADWNDVVEITSYHTDIEADVEAFMTVRDQHISQPFPAWTAVDIDRLYLARAIGEFSLTVYRPVDRTPGE